MQESMSHGLSEGEPLRVHTTMHRGAAPDHIHIYSSASSTVIAAPYPGMGRLPAALIKSLQKTDDCTPKSAATHAVSRQTDSLLSNFSEIKGRFSLACSSKLNDGHTLR